MVRNFQHENTVLSLVVHNRMASQSHQLLPNLDCKMPIKLNRPLAGMHKSNAV